MNFAQDWLNIQCSSIEGLHCALFLLAERQASGLKPVAQWPQDSREPLTLLAIAKLALKKQDRVVNANIINASDGKQAFDYIALPIYADQQLLGVIAVKTGHHDDHKRQLTIQALKTGANWLAMPNAVADRHYQTVVKMAVNALQQKDSLNEAYTALLSSFSDEFACERVVIAEVENDRARVVALSNSARFDDKTGLLQTLAAAMDEAIAQDRVIVYPPLAEEELMVTMAHADLAAKFSGGALCTIPLLYDDKIFAVLMMGRDENKPFDRQDVNICQQTLSLLTPFLKLKRDEERLLIQKFAASAKKMFAECFGLRYLGLKLSVLGFFLILGLTLWLEGDFHIHADAVIEGKVQRTLSAPMEGFIRSATVRAGDAVAKGEVVAVIEDRDLKLEKFKLAGQRRQLQRKYREAMANRELVKVRVYNAQLAQIEAQIKLKQEQLQRTRIRAPFDGIIIEGDLSQSLGAPVTRGQALFKIAPLSGYRVMLKVSEQDISYIRHAQTGTLGLSSLADRSFPLTIERIIEVARVDEGANIFRVEASLPGAPKLLRPGMEGVGKIDIGRKKLFWIWTHQWADWLKLRLWSWW
ncbi:HlyD family efflux transporter periplasmic adaptor subunit [Methylomarinum sp. Ch1-1]|uniref:HlyD family efflux transporter periplasmic adaptor subunit n=1 Tax=Methylomarinum roseum TaxID=3067653 RepID=A0AAU7NUG7_9GAMM|nr:HlyD family efflux transporter periplasmic adaptor subunit [Methylomarinum sp. Ch1-1]MDP4519656.1 HlyD family efflux transporter periplasmic adaptor subunit [Methylomarinum sp. Ch1-1]